MYPACITSRKTYLPSERHMPISGRARVSIYQEIEMYRADSIHSPIESIKPLGILIVNPDTAVRHLIDKSIPEQRRVRISLALSDDLSTAPDTPTPHVVLFYIKAMAWSNLNRLWKVCNRRPVAQIIFLS